MNYRNIETNRIAVEKLMELPFRNLLNCRLEANEIVLKTIGITV